RILTARGLGYGQDESDRRYAMAAAAHPNPLAAQVYMVQNLCPKWGGTFERVHAFARKAMEDAPPGSLQGALVADAYVEQFATVRTARARRDFADQPRVQKVITEAVERSVLHPDCKQTPGWVWAHSMFAVYYVHARLDRYAEP